MRQLEGRSLDVPVVTTIDGSVAGADLLKLADRTSNTQQVRPRTMGLFVSLVGAGTIELVAHVRVETQADGDLGWARCVDTGNLGLLYGAPLPSPATYIFLVNFAAIYSAFALLAQNNSGLVVVDEAKLIEYAEYVRER